MESIRRPGRYVTHLKAQYFLGDVKGEWKECTVFNISLKGMGIAFRESVQAGSTLHILIIKHKETTTVKVKGTLRWIKRRENDFIGGVELLESLDDHTFARLC